MSEVSGYCDHPTGDCLNSYQINSLREENKRIRDAMDYLMEISGFFRLPHDVKKRVLDAMKQGAN